jgi:hypothetical protein
MKSVSVRNLLGGFLGGSIGILASWYLSPYSLPFGVLLGVVVGWWHGDIALAFIEARRWTKETASNWIGSIEHVRVSLGQLRGASKLFALPFKWGAGFFLWAYCAPGRFKRWLREHPMNGASAVSIAALLTAVIAIPAIEGYFEFHNGLTQDGLAFLFALFLAMGALVHKCRTEFLHNSDLAEMNVFYREWEIVSRYGYFGFFFYEVFGILRYAVGLALFLAILAPWFFAFATVGIIGAFPVVLVISFAKGCYRILVRTGHWLCFSVTLAVTATSWLLFNATLADARLLWFVSLSTGVVSGGATEFARRALLLLYEGTRFGRALIRKGAIEDIAFGDDENGKWGYLTGAVFGCGALWLRQNRPARLLRSLCFSMPIARPVVIF